MCNFKRHVQRGALCLIKYPARGVKLHIHVSEFTWNLKALQIHGTTSALQITRRQMPCVPSAAEHSRIELRAERSSLEGWCGGL
jgi:hypothetical protein